ncbi:chemotaxis protein CheD [Limisphaera ngatamarikiensis]|uniref:Probable chemoreceptor glutamine deamidase CheD n=1 Tax=Limisphaera ngatamarikiensis TaxID=1324935 RepID=A0A6M1RYI5_9BACT|nr:chemotaxis protein CheD [Limisphaera ngatamarikiensis]NGO38240.1 chemotaxis protein CheD [Limisphaera ngatamarikiensis]
MPVPTQWVIAPPRKTVVVKVADAAASNDTGADLVTHSLGSCLGVTFYDPVAHVGGLLHVMLPDSSIDPARAHQNPCLFVDTGVVRLLQMFARVGGVAGRAVIKVAGGAQMLDEKGVFRIGERNVQALQRVLAAQSLRVSAWEVGGVISRTLRLNIATGEVTIQSPGQPPRRL